MLMMPMVGTTTAAVEYGYGDGSAALPADVDDGSGTLLLRILSNHVNDALMIYYIHHAVQPGYISRRHI